MIVRPLFERPSGQPGRGLIWGRGAHRASHRPSAALHVLRRGRASASARRHQPGSDRATLPVADPIAPDPTTSGEPPQNAREPGTPASASDSGPASIDISALHTREVAGSNPAAPIPRLGSYMAPDDRNFARFARTGRRAVCVASLLGRRSEPPSRPFSAACQICPDRR